MIGTAHGKLDQVFARLDRDKSGGVSLAELRPYLDAAIRGQK